MVIIHHPAHTAILSYFEAVFSFICKLIVHQGAGMLTNICSIIGGCLETPVSQNHVNCIILTPTDDV